MRRAADQSATPAHGAAGIDDTRSAEIAGALETGGLDPANARKCRRRRGGGQNQAGSTHVAIRMNNPWWFRRSAQALGAGIQAAGSAAARYSSPCRTSHFSISTAGSTSEAMAKQASSSGSGNGWVLKMPLNAGT